LKVRRFRVHPDGDAAQRQFRHWDRNAAGKDASLCATRCTNQQCVVCCPAGCWSSESGRVSLITDGCLVWHLPYHLRRVPQRRLGLSTRRFRNPLQIRI